MRSEKLERLSLAETLERLRANHEPAPAPLHRCAWKASSVHAQPRHGRQWGEVVEMVPALPPESCATCAGSLHTFEVDTHGCSRAVACEGWRRSEVARLTTAAMLPWKYQGEEGTLDGPFEAGALEAAKEGLPHGLLLRGGVGTGKTFLLWRMAKAIIRHHLWSVRWAGVGHLLPALRDGYSQRDASEERTIGPLKSARVLVLDELGKSDADRSHHERRVLSEVIESRYMSGRTLLLATTNHDERELEARLGPRVVSRLYEMCDVHVMDGADKRRRR